MHPITYYVDESFKTGQGNDTCAMIAVKTIVPEELGELIVQSIKKIVADPILSQHNGVSTSWIPHYCNDHPLEIHPIFLRDIARMPFEAYIVYCNRKNIEGHNEYDWYDYLVKVMFSFRLLADRGRSVKIVYEQHDSKIAKRNDQIKNLIDDIEGTVARRYRIIPREIQVISAGKEVVQLSLPDYIGGSFMTYHCNQDEKLHAAYQRKFSLIAKKVRWIKDIDSCNIYTSKGPYVPTA